MNAKQATIVVGTRVWFLEAPYSVPTRLVPMRVVKIGRRFAHLQNGYRFDFRTAIAQGYGFCSRPPRFDGAQFFLDRRTLTEQRDVAAAWEKLRSDLKEIWLVPPMLTVERIESARHLLFELPNPVPDDQPDARKRARKQR